MLASKKKCAKMRLQVAPGLAAEVNGAGCHMQLSLVLLL
jgi:hypothetical protein